MIDELTIGIGRDDFHLVHDVVRTETAWVGGDGANWGRWIDPSGAMVHLQDRLDGMPILGWGLADAGRIPLRSVRATEHLGGESQVVVGRVGAGDDGFELPVLLLGDRPPAPGDVIGALDIAVVGFCQEATTWRDESAYRASQPPDRSIMAVESLVALGLGPEAASSGVTSCEVFLTGVVVSAEVRVNQLTGRRFVRAVVRTWGLALTVAVADGQLAEDLAPGAVVQGTFNLVGWPGPHVRTTLTAASDPGSTVIGDSLGWRATPGHLLALEPRGDGCHLTRVPLGATSPDATVPLTGFPVAWDASAQLVALAFDDHIEVLDPELRPLYFRPTEPGWEVRGIIAGRGSAHVIATRPQHRPALPAPQAPGTAGPSWDVCVERISIGGGRDWSSQLGHAAVSLPSGSRVLSLRPTGRARCGVVAFVATVEGGNAAQLVVRLAEDGPAELSWWPGPHWLEQELRAGVGVARATTSGLTIDDRTLVAADRLGHGHLHEADGGSVVALWSDERMQLLWVDGADPVRRAFVGSADRCTIADDVEAVWLSPTGPPGRGWPVLRADRSGIWQVGQLPSGSAVIAAGGGLLYVESPTGRRFVPGSGLVVDPQGDDATRTVRIDAVPSPVTP